MAETAQLPPPKVEDDELKGSEAPLLDHLIELRKRLIYALIAVVVFFLACFAFAKQIYDLLLLPFRWAGGSSMIFTAPQELFFTYMNVALFGAIFLAFPIIAGQIYAFVAPGLYKRERRAFLPFLVAAPVLFVLGAALVYYMIMPFVLFVSLSQQIVGGTGISVQLLPKVSDYFDLLTTLILAFGLFFQLPVVLTLVAMAGLVSSKMLISGWRFAVAGIVIAAAIVTPPDPFSMTFLSLPIIALYFISIGCVRLIEGRRAKEDAAVA